MGAHKTQSKSMNFKQLFNSYQTGEFKRGQHIILLDPPFGLYSGTLESITLQTEVNPAYGHNPVKIRDVSYIDISMPNAEARSDILGVGTWYNHKSIQLHYYTDIDLLGEDLATRVGIEQSEKILSLLLPAAKP